jgi:hypothetical protein
MQYGELKIAKEHVSNFQGNKTKAVIFDDHENVSQLTCFPAF